jgi:ribosome maturation factor RimP
LSKCVEGFDAPLFFVKDMITAEAIRGTVEQKLEGTGHFVTEVEVTVSGRIHVYIDSFEKVTIQDCVGVHKNLKFVYGEDLDNYEVSVSSAGMDRPFKDSRQFHKNIGREVKVLLTDGMIITGILKAHQPDEIVIAKTAKPPKKGMKPKATEEQLVTIKFEQIKETKRVINFK